MPSMNPTRWTPPTGFGGALGQAFASLTKWLSVKLFAVGPVQVYGAAAPPAVDGNNVTYLVQTGAYVATTDVNGVHVHTLPKAFPNGIISCFYMSVNNVNSFEVWGADAVTLQTINVRGSTASVVRAFSYIVYGW